jgi:hypothetical protein
MGFSNRVKTLMKENLEASRETQQRKLRAELIGARAELLDYWEKHVPLLNDLVSLVRERGVDARIADLRCRDAESFVSVEESRAERVVFSLSFEELQTEVQQAKSRAISVPRTLFLSIDRLVEYLTEIDVQDERLDRAILYVTRAKLARDPVTIGPDQTSMPPVQVF